MVGPITTPSPLLNTGTSGAEAAQTVTQDPAVGQGSSGAAGATPPPALLAGAGALVGTSVPSNGSEAQQELQSAIDVLNDPNSSVEDKLKAILGAVRDPDVLAKLMIEFANMGRQNALDNRLAAREAARGDLEGQAAETREAAQKQLVAAVVTLVVAVVSFVVSAVGDAKAGKEGMKAKGASDVADTKAADAASLQRGASEAKNAGLDVAPEMKEASKLMQREAAKAAGEASNAQAKMGQIISGNQQQVGMMQGIGGAVSKGVDSSASVDQAEGQEKAAKAQEEQSNADLSKKFMEDLDQLVKSAIQFLKEMQQAETDLMANMTRV